MKALRAGYLALATADTLLAGSNRPGLKRLRYLTKPLLMPVLSADLVLSTPARTPLRQATIAAQAFSWGGDVALLGSGKRTFLAGLGSFFAAHVSYVAGFRSVREDGGLTTEPGPRGAAAAWALLAPAMALAAGRRDPALRLPVAAYATVLAGMAATSTALDRELPVQARRTIAAGTLLFLVSDSALGLRKFVLGTESPALERVVMATYTAAQLLIADGVAQAAGHDEP